MDVGRKIRMLVGLFSTHWCASFKTVPVLSINISGLYYKKFAIVNDTSGVIRLTNVSDATTWSVTIRLTLTLLELSITLLENIYGTLVTHDNHTIIKIFL
jgi:hypothetical protein